MKLYHAYLIFLFLLAGCASILPGVALLPTHLQKASQPASLLENANTATSIPQFATESIPGNIPRISRENLNSLIEITTLPIKNVIRLEWLPDSKTLAVITQSKVKILQAASLAIQQEYSLPENSSLMDFNSVAQLLALTIDRQSLSIRDLSGKEIQMIKPTEGFGSASFNPDGSKIVVSSMEEFKAESYDIKSGEEISICGGFETAAPIYSVSPSPQGRWLVWMARATVQLSNPQTCKAVTHIGHEDFVISHAFNQDESILATSTGGTVNGEFVPLIYLWNTATGLSEGSIILKEAPARSLSFSPDGSLLASAGNGLFLWDSASGKDVKTLAQVDQEYNSVAFSPDGAFLAAATESDLKLFAIQP